MELFRPDLVALQEVDESTERAGGVNQLAEIGRRTGMHAEFGKAMSYMGGGYGVAVLSRWPIVGARNDALPTTPEREPRTALTVDVRPSRDGPLLHFTSTHLDQGREQELRISQARSLNELLIDGHDRPGILAGDMNARPDTDVLKVLGEQWANALAGDPFAIGPSGRPRSRSDYVLYRPAQCWRVVESLVLDETVTSDHRPLFVVLEWTGLC
jgi:endonuclease/exonuclease/phosphatase family metal-dependent hydrolase